MKNYCAFRFYIHHILYENIIIAGVYNITYIPHDVNNAKLFLSVMGVFL